MTLEQIYKYLNSLINADSLGGDLNLKEFNYMLQDENINLFKEEVEHLYTVQRADALKPEVVYSSKMLRKFINETTIAPTVGVVNLSSQLTSYAYFLACRTAAAYNGQIRNIPLVTHETFNIMASNLLSKPLKKNPVCVIDIDSLRIRPTNITSVIINYLRFPATPVFDYYINATDDVVYLAAAATHALTSGETGSVGQTTGTVTSLTVELEYSVDFHSAFLNRLLGRLGLPQRDQALIQTAMMNKQEQEAK
jgi:hypothetical protein